VGDDKPATPTYWLTRAVFLRVLGFIYFVAFVSLARQLLPLLGSHGLLPVKPFLARVAVENGGGWAAVFQLPTIFWWSASDAFMQAMAWVGVALSLVVIAGLADAVLLALLWLLYLSFVHVGQLFYSFGWEILLLETGFLAVFLCPPLRFHPLPERTPPPLIVVVLLRWVLFRVMFGAGLIKIRGDECWRDLTCLVYHYETQPLPNPLSWLLHQAPRWLHQGGVLFNHFVELVVPFGLFGPRRVRLVAGLLQAAFQLTLILSGNLSWLNWLTLGLAVVCFDDQALGKVFPRRLRDRIAAVAARTRPPSRAQWAVSGALALLVAYLSIDPIANLFKADQVMNSSFDRLHLVNTYGAFGSVGRHRPEIVLEGTADTVVGEHTRWIEYEFPCKPGDPLRRPCVVAPYHYRLDWEIWFAAMSNPGRHAWLVHLVWKLLHNDPGALSLLANNPFPGAPPRHVRALLYEYEFTRFGEPGWWHRRLVREWLPPLSADTPELRTFLADHGWLVE
jgi:hypothetical protein